MAATASTGPLIPRRRLGAALRELREGRGETLQQTAAALLFSPSKLSRIENGLAGEPHPRDVRDLIAHFGLEGADDAGHLEELAAAGRVPGWWQVPPYQMSPRLDTFISYESAASRIEGYVPTAVPAVLQTADYAAAALSRLAPSLTASEVEQQVDLRMRRQREVRGRDPSPSFRYTVPETVLHRQVGSATTMREQLTALVEVYRDPAVDLHVIPFRAGLYRAAEGATLTLFHFEDALDPDVIGLETVSSIQFVDGEDRIRDYREAFSELARVRLDREASCAFIEQLTSASALTPGSPDPAAPSGRPSATGNARPSARRRA